MKSELIDNRKIHSTRQEGISRVIQRKGEMDQKCQPGKMSGKPTEKAQWRRGDSLTPRKG